MLFDIFDANNSKNLDLGEIISLLEIGEKTLDSRLNTFQDKAESFFNKLAKDEYGMIDCKEFKRAFKNE